MEATESADIQTQDLHERWSRKERFTDIIGDPWFQLLIRLQHVVSSATFAFWASRGAVTIHLPITTNAVSSPMGLGSDSLPVEIELFNQRTYLADSMQFLLEYGCRFHEAGCFYLMPSFRGESADESHLCQFYHSEAEIPGSLEDAMACAEDYFRYVTRAVINECAGLLDKHAAGVTHMEEVLGIREFPCITFDEAVKVLRGGYDFVRYEAEWRTLTRAGEQELMRRLGSPVWVTNYDHLSVPFYQAIADDGRSARNADFLLGIGEVIGLGERHVTSSEALAALEMHRVEPAPYGWYLDMKRLHPLQTSGFGMGVERFLLWVLCHRDIRDLQILPRFNGVAIIP